MKKADRKSSPRAKEAAVGAVAAACSLCGAATGEAKFCPECGTPITPPHPTCAGCGHQLAGDLKFCPECGMEIRARG